MRTKILSLMAALLLSLATGYGQSVIFDEGFENGTTGWTIVNGNQTNKWYRGTATKASGSYAIYISNNSGTSNSYSTSSSSVVHFYKDINFPASTQPYTLTFKWKGMGESIYDDLKVYLVPTTTTPVAGTNLSTSYLLGTYRGYTTWQTSTVSLPAASYSGTTNRLVFSWRNNGSGGTTPPIAIDDITLIYFVQIDGIVYLLDKTAHTATLSDLDKDAALTNIVIPETVSYEGENYSVTSIGNSAFSYTGIVSVTIPASVINIGEEAFLSNNHLASFTVAGDNPNYSSENGILFNKDKSTLIKYPAAKTETSYTIPTSVTRIGDWAFEYCTNLESITIPASVSTIGHCPFAYINLHLYFEATVAPTLSGYIFCEAGSLTIHIPFRNSGYTYANGWSGNLSSWISIGNLQYAIYNLENNTVSVRAGENFNAATLSIPGTITYDGETYTVQVIAENAFYEYRQLVSVTIPGSVTYINHQAFSNTGLTSITIP
ncbi:MAG: leucine-rich repeat domain-containing protein, partial [Tannerellaceae bacterium]|nr:leucine-rich repeat domain-containing protein [Tannerellaceae bacterium]